MGRKSGADRDRDTATDRVKAAAKAMEKKVTNPDRHLETKYTVDKAKKTSISLSFHCV